MRYYGSTSDLTGRLLVASPTLVEPTFARTVILLLDHNDDSGSLGIVINRPMSVNVDSILAQWQPLATSPGHIYEGGPVGKDSALGIALVPGDTPEPSGVRRVSGAVGLVDLDSDPGELVGHVAGLRIFVGYAGWGAGQLRDELLQESWFVVESQASDGFSRSPEDLWVDVLKRQPGDLSLVASYPSDPALN